MIKLLKAMSPTNLNNKIVLVTGAAKRIGHLIALACARSGADVIIHYNQSKNQAIETKKEIHSLGRRAWILSSDLSQPESVHDLLVQASKIGTIFALVNNAAIFEPISLLETTLSAWQSHLNINLTAPFILSQGFASQVPKNETGRIINIVDWRALIPGSDHFPYSVSKAALAAMTKSMAISLAPNITVNALALGAIMPPTNKPSDPNLLNSVPAARWGNLNEVEEALIFLLTGPAYITGEIIHVDGGRHLL
jgi:NAD(P)-dependent dehydrogenase (short-subunit alcohol dehydrogenase family)